MLTRMRTVISTTRYGRTTRCSAPCGTKTELAQFYARTVQEAERKRQTQYQTSFQRNVGSSFDPTVEDPNEWENGGDVNEEPRPPSEFDEDEFDAAELAAVDEDEEAAYWAAVGETGSSGVDALTAGSSGVQRMDDDVDMDMS